MYYFFFFQEYIMIKHSLNQWVQGKCNGVRYRKIFATDLKDVIKYQLFLSKQILTVSSLYGSWRKEWYFIWSMGGWVNSQQSDTELCSPEPIICPEKRLFPLTTISLFNALKFYFGQLLRNQTSQRTYFLLLKTRHSSKEHPR